MVLRLNDTTELNFNGQEIAGLGPLSYEAQRGMYFHATYAVTLQREPLGVLNAWMWAIGTAPAGNWKSSFMCLKTVAASKRYS